MNNSITWNQFYLSREIQLYSNGDLEVETEAVHLCEGVEINAIEPGVVSGKRDIGFGDGDNATVRVIAIMKVIDIYSFEPEEVITGELT